MRTLLIMLIIIPTLSLAQECSDKKEKIDRVVLAYFCDDQESKQFSAKHHVRRFKNGDCWKIKYKVQKCVVLGVI